ncbi:MAG: NADH-quinone oxidoreductase subunit NuoH [Candidatus Nanopelagicales bacterium]|nr:NADH-quinone oxidoreductase subunit NuoH [Candidatus Nanopelagicales bacterium]
MNRMLGAIEPVTVIEPEGAFNIPVWLMIIKVVGIFVLLVVIVIFTIWFERRVVGRMQNRIGPNRTGPFGLLQTLMDGIKLALKEEIFPKAADKIVYIIAPVLSAVMAFAAWAVIPLGPEVSMFGYRTPLQLADFPVALLYVLAIASIGIYGVVLAGWSSGSTYPLLGGLRSSAQMISYELSMSLSFVAVFLLAGTMSTSGIVDAQQKLWFAVLLLPSFMVYATSMVAETNRAPFDLAEAESELTGGFHTEYSSLKFAMFFLGEYINMVTVSAVATTIFLGGWRAPWPISLWDSANTGWYPLIWFLIKVFLFIFVFIWLRGTLPRFRYDQFMHFGWKVLIPVSILWILIIACIGGLHADGVIANLDAWAVGAGVLLTVLLLTLAGHATKRRLRRGIRGHPIPQRFDPYSDGFPVPPLPGQIAGRSAAAGREEGDTHV